MDADSGSNETERLGAFIGTWALEVAFPGAPPPPPAPPGGPRAEVSFEWLAGETFLVQRWSVPIPEAPDGIAIIGWNEDRGTFLQHYFDSRGVARVYEMEISDGAWTLTRTAPDFTELSFSQRYTGTFSDDGGRIDGRWETSHDGGATWELDFELSYVRD